VIASAIATEHAPAKAACAFKTWAAATLLVLLVACNVLTLVDAAFNAKAYSVVEAFARATGMGALLSNSPVEFQRKAIEAAARQSAEMAVRQQTIAMNSLVANSLVLVDTTRALAKEHALLRHRHETLAATSKTVARRVAMRTASSAKRTVATLAGKAVPYLGAATVLGLSAVDIADACQTLKDANALASEVDAAIGEEERVICGLQVPSLEQVKAWTGGVWR
jgi:hypothetical protein